MRLSGTAAWGALLVQSLAVFCLLLGLGVGLLAAGIIWARARRRGPIPTDPPRKPPIH